MTPGAPLSLRAYAAHRTRQGLRGGSLAAVQRAIDSGRLRASVVDGRIADPELADREWAANTDETRRPTADSRQLAGDDESPEPDKDSFAYWKTQKMRLDYERASGLCVNAAEMQADIADTFSTVRTRLLGIVTKVKQTHPDLPLTVYAAIDGAVREALEELAAPVPTEEGEDAA